MAKLTITQITGTISSSLLSEFKQYASVPDTTNDTLLTGILKQAILRVQEYSDRALLACSVKQQAAVPMETGIIQLYLGGGEVSSVINMKDGSDVMYNALPGGRLGLYLGGGEVEVTFTVTPAENALEQVKETVFRYATAVYDGEDSGVLGSILNEVL